MKVTISSPSGEIFDFIAENVFGENFLLHKSLDLGFAIQLEVRPKKAYATRQKRHPVDHNIKT